MPLRGHDGESKFTSEAWEAWNKTLKAIDLAALSFPSDGLNWKLNGNESQLRIATALYCPFTRGLTVTQGGFADLIIPALAHRCCFILLELRAVSCTQIASFCSPLASNWPVH